MTTTGEKIAENPSKIRWGAHFKATREAMHLSEKDAASRLHLNASLITVIESEAFNGETPVIFMRGYVRSYARLLNISDKHINQALIDLGLAEQTTSKISPPSMLNKKIDTRTSNNSQFTSWSTSLVVLVLVGLVGMWWNTHSRNTAADNTVVQNTTPGSTIAPNATPSDPTPKELANSVTQAETEAPIPAPPPSPTVAAEKPGQTNTNLPGNEQNSIAATTPAAPQAPVTNNTAATQPNWTEPQSPPTDMASGNNPTTTNTDPATTAPVQNPLAAIDQSLAESTAPTTTKPPVLAKKHSKHHQPTAEDSSDDMALPEPGLVPEPGSEGDPTEN